MSYLIILILFHDVGSILAIELLNQGLNRSQRFKNIATNLCFDIVNVSRFKHEINNTRMFRIFSIDVDDEVRNAKSRQHLRGSDLNDQLTRYVALNFFRHGNLSENGMGVGETGRMIMRRVYHFQTSRSVVAVIFSFGNQRK